MVLRALMLGTKPVQQRVGIDAEVACVAAEESFDVDVATHGGEIFLLQRREIGLAYPRLRGCVCEGPPLLAPGCPQNIPYTRGHDLDFIDFIRDDSLANDA
jgi:hypothetical protein